MTTETTDPGTPAAAPVPEDKKRRRSDKCRFCRMDFPPDYKDVDMLARLLTGQGKLFSRKRSGNCAFHQRMLGRAVKQARTLALLSYVG
jgi:small subunit ribosomal protein S18